MRRAGALPAGLHQVGEGGFPLLRLALECRHQILRARHAAIPGRELIEHVGHKRVKCDIGGLWILILANKLLPRGPHLPVAILTVAPHLLTFQVSRVLQG